MQETSTVMTEYSLTSREGIVTKISPRTVTDTLARLRAMIGAFKTLAENIAESLGKGDRVFVHGTVTTEAWTDKQTGEKRTAQRVLAEIVGPSLRWATARITKTIRTSAADEDLQHIGEHEA